MLHVFGRFRGGAWRCVMCKADRELLRTYGLDHGDDCPGLVEPAYGTLGIRLSSR